MQHGLVDGVLESLRIGVGFLWTAAWAISMGLVITSPVQVYVSKSGWRGSSARTTSAG